ncbi:MAG TPA: acetyl-CoA carboxylase carboxyltransferase subunit beta [Thermoleophilia bacterium]|nr:acetyl-CoA carboxylase carboxyltransferase subunit beta [Thermoleophilia bacterium]
MAKYVTVQVTRKEPPGAPEVAGERCKKCGRPLAEGELEASLQVCPHCAHHYLVPAHTRVAQLADPGTVTFFAEELRPTDPLEFYDTKPYPERVSEAQLETGLTESLLAATCKIEKIPVALGVMEFRFLGGSMGSVMGERFWRLAQVAIVERRAMVVVVTSGGARMQESLVSLMQMAKTIVAARILAEARLPFVTVLTHPTTGGVFASLATVADVIMAEPGAVMQFAGRRIIEQTTREKLPSDFGSSESQVRHGQVDMVVDRRELKSRLAWTLRLLGGFGIDGD